MPDKTQKHFDQGLDRPVYFDYQATTPLDPRVLNAMLPYFRDQFGNPHSVHHAYGWEAAKAIGKAREEIASLIGAQPEEIVFTSGATEANNIAISGLAGSEPGPKRHVISCVTEHVSVLEPVRALMAKGFRVTELPVQANGRINTNDLDKALQDDALLVSIMAVNNEIGVIQPLEEIGAMCASRGVVFHTDAAQAVGKIALDARSMQIGMMSISGHKIYGPKGVGALYVRSQPEVPLSPLTLGGGQEHGLRAGTLPAALCVGLGVACRVAAGEMAADNRRISGLRHTLYDGLCEKLPGVVTNGDTSFQIPGNLSLSFDGIDAEELIMEVKDLAMSTGSACSSTTIGPSHVLQALGIDDDQAHSTIRIGIGRFTTGAEIDFAVARVASAVRLLRIAKAEDHCSASS